MGAITKVFIFLFSVNNNLTHKDLFTEQFMYAIKPFFQYKEEIYSRWFKHKGSFQQMFNWGVNQNTSRQGVSIKMKWKTKKTVACLLVRHTLLPSLRPTCLAHCNVCACTLCSVTAWLKQALKQCESCV